MSKRQLPLWDEISAQGLLDYIHLIKLSYPKIRKKKPSVLVTITLVIHIKAKYCKVPV